MAYEHSEGWGAAVRFCATLRGIIRKNAQLAKGCHRGPVLSLPADVSQIQIQKAGVSAAALSYIRSAQCQYESDASTKICKVASSVVPSPKGSGTVSR